MSTESRREAARRLLAAPFLLASHDPETHLTIRREADELSKLFRSYLGYRLEVDSRWARLFKAGRGEGDGRAFLRAGTKMPFSTDDYTCLALLCAVLVSSRRQVLLSTVVKDVRQAAVEAGIDLGEDSLSGRRNMVRALRCLIDLGAVVEDAGSVGSFGNTLASFDEDTTQEALLFVEPEIIRLLLAVSLREVDSPAELIRRSSSVAPDAVRHAVRRRMVECPVVMAGDLSEEELAWLRQYQRREAGHLENDFGLKLEIRAEGVAAFDPHEELSDMPFPTGGTLGHIALLAVAELVSRLTGQARGEVQGEAPHPAPATQGIVEPSYLARRDLVAVPPGLLNSIVHELLATHPRTWAKDQATKPERLVADVEDLLEGSGLMERTGTGEWMLRAVAARFLPSVEDEEDTGVRSTQDNLFDMATT